MCSTAEADESRRARTKTCLERPLGRRRRFYSEVMSNDAPKPLAVAGERRVKLVARALALLAILCVFVTPSACTRSTPRESARPEPVAAPGDRRAADERSAWVLRARVSPCSGMPWFVPLVRDLDGDGRDDLLLGCSNKLAVSFGGDSRETLLEPTFRIEALDRLIYSAAPLALGRAPSFLIGGDASGVVVAESSPDDSLMSTRRVELDAWRHEGGEPRAGSVRLLDDGGALEAGIVYAAGPGALVELEWRREGGQPGTLHERRSWPLPPVGRLDRLVLADLRGDGERGLVLLAGPRTRTSECRMVVIEWPTARRDGRLELGEPQEHLVERACASVPVGPGDARGVPVRLERGVGLLRHDGARVDVQLELAPPVSTEDSLVQHVPLALLLERSRPDSSRVCARVVVKEYTTDADNVIVSAGALFVYRVEDGVVTGFRSARLPEELELGAVARGDFDGEGHVETLLIDEQRPQHVVSRGLGRGCDAPTRAR